MNEQQLSDLLKFASEFSSIKEEEQKKLPFHLNLVDQLHINENAHSRILMHLLSYKNDNGKYVFLTSLIDLIKEKQSGDFGKITIESPQITQEKERIDLWVRDNDYAIIFENKIYNAADQDAQISRYINKTKEGLRNYREEDIYVVYLSQYPKEPELQSWGEYKDSFRSRYVNLSFCYDILPWLKDKILPNIKYKELFLQTAIIQYIDYLEGLFKIRNTDKPMNMELNRFIEHHFNLTCESAKDKIRNIQKSALELDDLSSQMKALLESYRQIIFESWREQTRKKYSGLQPNKKHDEKGWYITDVTISNVYGRQVTVYMGADHTGVNTVSFYCGFFIDDNSADENESVLEKLKKELQLFEINDKAQPKQIFKGFEEDDYKDDYDVVYKAFCDIVNKAKSINEQSCS